MSNSRSGFQQGNTRSAITRARHSVTSRRNGIESIERRHDRELGRALRALSEAEAHLARLEAEEAAAKDES